MGLGYYGAWLLYGFKIENGSVTTENDCICINGILYEENEENMISIHLYGDDDTDGYFLSWNKSKLFRGGGMWDNGGEITFDVIKSLHDSYDETRVRSFCLKYNINYIEPTFNILLSNGQVKY